MSATKKDKPWGLSENIKGVQAMSLHAPTSLTLLEDS
jgi:hypothetical protein